jgi:phage shock protein A
MSTPLERKIEALEAEIEGYRVRLEAATTEARKDLLLEVITARGNNLTELLKAQAAAVGASGKHLPPLCSHASFCVRL